MVHAGLLLAVVALVVRPIQAENDLVDFPTEFGLNTATTFTWDNPTGYIAGIRVVQTNSEEGGENWLLEPNCDDTCTGYENTGNYTFGGSSANDSSGESFATGSGYTIQILFSPTQTYDDVDKLTTTVTSPSFSIVSSVSATTTSAPTSSTASSTASASPTKTPSGGLDTGAIVAFSVIGGIVLLILGGWFCLERAEAKHDAEKGNFSEKSPALAAAKRSVLKRKTKTALSGTTVALKDAGGKLYIDDKVELPTQFQTSHELANNEALLPGLDLPAPQNPVEMPDSSATARGGAQGLGEQSRSHVNTLYAPHVVPPSSPGGISYFTSVDEHELVGSGAPAENVSLITPIARKPVSEMSQLRVPGSFPEDAAEADPTLSREKSIRTEPKENNSRVWKMLGGGSVYDKLKPASGTQ